MEWLYIYIWVFPKKRGTPNSSILIRFSIINHPFWGTTIFWNTQFTQKFWHEFGFIILKFHKKRCQLSQKKGKIGWCVVTMIFSRFSSKKAMFQSSVKIPHISKECNFKQIFWPTFRGIPPGFFLIFFWNQQYPPTMGTPFFRDYDPYPEGLKPFTWKTMGFSRVQRYFRDPVDVSACFSNFCHRNPETISKRTRLIAWDFHVRPHSIDGTIVYLPTNSP